MGPAEPTVPLIAVEVAYSPRAGEVQRTTLALLRHGLVPARELPSVNRQRPHFVAQMYRRQAER